MIHKTKRLSLFITLLSLLLLVSCSDNTTADISPPPAPAASPSPPPEITYKIKTDYSKLMPYEPLQETYTRLTDAPMPELVPSESYGPLLPYAGEEYDYYYPFYHYGLVTRDGKMVTDPVYSKVRQVYWYDMPAQELVYEPFYILAQPPVDMGDQFVSPEKTAVCALDGSWMTAFDYTSVCCYDKVMFLIRDFKTNDADVMDYTGKILYRTKDLACYEKLPEYTFYDSGADGAQFGGGYYTMLNYPNRENISFFNELTGALTQVAYDDARYFSGGLAAVGANGLWGYIDTNLREVIPPQFTEARPFENGRAVVRTASGDALIDEAGNVLLTSPLGIDARDDFYAVYGGSEADHMYGPDLKELFNSQDVEQWNRIYKGNRGVNRGSAGFSAVKGDVTLVFVDGTVHQLPGQYSVQSVYGRYLIALAANQTACLMNLDGAILAKSHPEARIDGVFSGSDGRDRVLINDNNYPNTGYRLVDTEGQTLLSGAGSAEYDAESGLVRVNDTQFFGYADADGRFVFRVSLLSDLPD